MLASKLLSKKKKKKKTHVDGNTTGGGCLVTLTSLGVDMVILFFSLDHKGGP